MDECHCCEKIGNGNTNNNVDINNCTNTTLVMVLKRNNVNKINPTNVMNFTSPKCSWHNNHMRWNIEKHHDLERLVPINNQNIPQPLMHVFNHKNLKLEITNTKSTSEAKPTLT